MNSSLVCINILLKKNVNKPSLINFLNEVSTKSLRDYLRLANIYDDNSNKKSDLIEMIIYGCINGKLNNIKNIDHISTNKAHIILKENDIVIKSFPGYGNINKRKKDIKPYVENIKLSVKIE